MLLIALAVIALISSLSNIFRKKKSKKFSSVPVAIHVFILVAVISLFTNWFIRSDAQSKIRVIHSMHYTCEDFIGSTSQLLYRYSGIAGHPINTLDMQSNLCGSTFSQHEEDEGIDAGRLERWSFAFDLFRNTSVTKKIFGDGFNYLPLFGKKFLSPAKSAAGYDYPHNFILAALLYSGLVGCIFILVLLSRSLMIYWLRKKDFFPFLICILITLFYACLSGNSIFSIHILMLLLLLSIPVRLTSLQRDPSSPQ
jgi:hypothetical protein